MGQHRETVEYPFGTMKLILSDINMRCRIGMKRKKFLGAIKTQSLRFT
jgi:hypothetical protein